MTEVTKVAEVTGVTEVTEMTWATQVTWGEGSDEGDGDGGDVRYLVHGGEEGQTRNKGKSW